MRARGVAVNFLALAGANAVQLALSLVTVPLVLRYAGEGTLGAARALQDALGYLALLELGLSGALRPLYVEALASGERTRVLAVHGAAFRAFARVVIAIGVVSVLTAPLVARMRVGGDATPAALAGAFVVGALGYVGLLARPFSIAQEAAQRAHRVAGFGLLQAAVLSATSVGFAVGGFGVIGQMAAATAGGLSFGVAALWSSRDELLATIRVAAHRAPIELRRRLWRLNWSTFFNDLCGRLCLFTDNLIVAAFHGASAVVPFAYTQRLLTVVQGNLQALGNASWAGLSDLLARREIALFEQRLLELSKLVVAMSGVALVPLVAVNHGFVQLWLGPSRYAGEIVTGLAALNAWILPLLSLWGWCFVGSGNVRRLNGMSAGQTLINVTVSLAATARLGVWGPLLGTLAGYLGAPLWWMPGEMKRLFGIRRRALIITCLRPVLVCLPLAAAFHQLVATLAPLSWATLIAAALIAAMVTAISVGWLAFSADERQRAWRLARDLAGR